MVKTKHCHDDQMSGVNSRLRRRQPGRLATSPYLATRLRYEMGESIQNEKMWTKGTTFVHIIYIWVKFSGCLPGDTGSHSTLLQVRFSCFRKKKLWIEVYCSRFEIHIDLIHFVPLSAFWTARTRKWSRWSWTDWTTCWSWPGLMWVICQFLTLFF